MTDVERQTLMKLDRMVALLEVIAVTLRPEQDNDPRPDLGVSGIFNDATLPLADAVKLHEGSKSDIYEWPLKPKPKGF